MTTKRFATRDFKDEGTGRSFKLGDELKDVKDGDLANYEAGGLAGDEPAKAAAKADPATTGTTATTAGSTTTKA